MGDKFEKPNQYILPVCILFGLVLGAYLLSNKNAGVAGGSGVPFFPNGGNHQATQSSNFNQPLNFLKSAKTSSSFMSVVILAVILFLYTNLGAAPQQSYKGY